LSKLPKILLKLKDAAVDLGFFLPKFYSELQYFFSKIM